MEGRRAAVLVVDEEEAKIVKPEWYLLKLQELV